MTSLNCQNIFQELQNPAEDALRKTKDLQELVNNDKWEDGEQNKGKYNSIETSSIGAKIMLKSIHCLQYF